MKLLFILIMGLAQLAVIVEVRQSKNPRAMADRIIINAKVITVDSSDHIAQAIAISKGRIVAVGTTTEILQWKGSGTEVTDLKGKTIVPGFIDGHSHFMSLGRQSNADISAPPVGTVRKIADIVTTLQRFKEEKKLNKGDWIYAFGYDADQLEEKRHPTKEDLDGAFPEQPLVLRHVSGHMLVANSAALKASGLDATTADPAGGVIVRKTGSREPAGLLQEKAMGLLKAPRKPEPNLQQQFESLRDQQLFYASNGITTAQDGYSSFESVKLLREAARAKQLFIDIEALPGYAILDSVLKPGFEFGVLRDHLKLAGFKLVSDGSPQGRTAFFTKPYLVEVPGCTHDHCTGFPTVTQQQFDDAVLKGFTNGVRTFVHCNGDATIDMYLEAIKKADSTLNTTGTNRRPVVIHSQFVRPDQLDAYRQLGIVPALFSNHAFFWGDVHVRNLGEARAFFLSPLKSSLKRGIVATNHTDWGVTPLNQLFLLWTSVARESRSGKVIGPNERLSVLEGLRAITINGAYQYKEEKIKGSIETGKLADLAVLSDDITTIDASRIKSVTVLETIKEGKTIYQKK